MLSTPPLSITSNVTEGGTVLPTENVTGGTETADDKMSINERYQYLRRIQGRYRQATRQAKKAVLDEIVAHTGMHRKSVIRRLNGSLERHPRRGSRGPEYRADFDSAIQVIWKATDYVCAERLTPNLLTTAELLEVHHELILTPGLKEQFKNL